MGLATCVPLDATALESVNLKEKLKTLKVAVDTSTFLVSAGMTTSNVYTLALTASQALLACDEGISDCDLPAFEFWESLRNNAAAKLPSNLLGVCTRLADDVITRVMLVAGGSTTVYFVFDGEPHPTKRHTHQARFGKYKKASEILHNSGASETEKSTASKSLVPLARYRATTPDVGSSVRRACETSAAGGAGDSVLVVCACTL